ncbi:chromate transporter [Mycoplasmopsis cynos]|uniref:chromate transporter n=1 Tax=Mycoplasmopsis cynos TaxID=171284 RepID=UPI002AFEC355|nr:chromate transporter [Mycoplasmopsis cynos]WQQ16316.1 chromate transporter [Mycoplasmopsis cynos]
MQEKIGFWKLFFFILKISFIGFGGGNALMPVIKKEIVENKKLLDVKEFDQIVIVTNMLPGASVIQCISYISIKLLGKVKGIIITLFALLPHIMFSFGLLLLFSKIPEQYVQIFAIGVLVSIIAFLIDFGINYLKQSRQNIKPPFIVLIFLFSFSFCFFVPAPFNVPILAIIFVLVIYFIIYWIKNKGGK